VNAVSGHCGADCQGSTLLSVCGLGVNYRGADDNSTPSVRDVCFDIHATEIVGIIGESGSGKSTLARALMGLLPKSAHWYAESSAYCRPDGTEVDFIGTDIQPSLRGTQLGFVPQAAAGSLNPVMRIDAQFRRTLAAHSISWREDGRSRALAALQQAGLQQSDVVLRSYPHELSGGMAQRVVFALSSVLEPRVLIADEPTSALDASVQQQMLNMFCGQVRTAGNGAIVITHDIRLAKVFCDSVLVMKDGDLVESGPTGEVLGNPQHPYTIELLDATPAQIDVQPPSRTHDVGFTHGARSSACPRQHRRAVGFDHVVLGVADD